MFPWLVVSEVPHIAYLQHELPTHTIIMKFSCVAAFLLLFHLSLPAQNTPTSLYAKADSAMKARDLELATSLWKAFLKTGHMGKTRGFAYSKLGASYFNLYVNDSAIKYMNLSIAEKSKTSNPRDTTFLRDHAILGYIYRYEVNQARKALKHYEAERLIIEANPEIATEGQRYQNFYNLATTNRLLEDFDRGLNYAYRALDATMKDPNAKPHHLPNCYAVIANALNNTQRYEEAEEYYKLKISSNIKLNGSESPSLSLDYYNLAVNSNSLDKPRQAVRIFQKGLDLIRLNTENPNLESSIYIGLGRSYRLMNDFEKSVMYVQKAIGLAPEISSDRALAYRQYALYHEVQGQYDLAINKYQLALAALIPGFQAAAPEASPEIVDLLTQPLAYEILSYKAYCWLRKYRATQDRTALTNAYSAYKKLDQSTDGYRQNFVLESSRLHFQKKNHRNYERSIEVVYEMYGHTQDDSYLEQAWLLIEKNKSLLLLENVLRAEKYTNLGIPDSIQERMTIASKSLLNAQKNLNSCELQKDCEQDQIISIRRTISLEEEQLRSFKSDIEKSFPEYYSFTSDNELQSLATIQSALKNDQLLINYFAGQDYYYFVAISGNESFLGRIKKDQNFDTELFRFLEEISGETLQNTSMKKALERYSTAAYYLYNKLIRDHFDIAGYRRLIVIPDGDLAGVPFEALISNTPGSESRDFHQLQYLLKTHRINYGFSATLWSKNIAINSSQQSLKLMAFGTSQVANRPELATLNAIEKELNTISQIQGSTLFSQKEATAENFRANATEANMIHLALHNINDYENPLNSQLVFSSDTSTRDGSLYLYEIFNLKMNPSLVVLSGCETGVGKWQRGEGTYHMGRAFLFHGNPALIMSLWRVSDATTAEIMDSFYSKLQQDASSSESIHEAKLAYLQKADGITAHPRNWAAFISIGQVKAESKKIDAWLIAIASIILLLIIGFKARQRRVQSH
ncbi:MAG: CHAT domain-containing protein [Roseivirga sp.]|nr:CHAT domain-containing protein [Roseivirga sp.]